MGNVFEDWNYEFDIKEIENSSNHLFELEMKRLGESVVKALDNAFNTIKIEDDKDFARSNEELRSLLEKNKELKQELEMKQKELKQQQTQYETSKRDQALLDQEVKETHEAFLLARKHYKKCLNFYYSIESRTNDTQVVFVQFFTELKKSDDNYYSVRIQKNIKTQQYTLLSMNPSTKLFEELKSKLQETNDISGIICLIRQAFILHKQTEQKEQLKIRH